MQFPIKKTLNNNKHIFNLISPTSKAKLAAPKTTKLTPNSSPTNFPASSINSLPLGKYFLKGNFHLSNTNLDNGGEREWRSFRLSDCNLLEVSLAVLAMLVCSIHLKGVVLVCGIVGIYLSSEKYVWLGGLWFGWKCLKICESNIWRFVA